MNEKLKVWLSRLFDVGSVVGFICMMYLFLNSGNLWLRLFVPIAILFFVVISFSGTWDIFEAFLTHYLMNALCSQKFHF